MIPRESTRPCDISARRPGHSGLPYNTDSMDIDSTRLEFALLMERTCEKPSTPIPEPGVGEPDRQRLYEILRDEMDNIRRFLNIWGSDTHPR